MFDFQIDFAHIYFSGFEIMAQSFLVFDFISCHFQIESVFNRRDTVMSGAPVGHHESVESPLFP